MVIKVAERRNVLGLSQVALAELAGVGQHTISDIETGKHIPRVDVAIDICQALGCAVEDLFIVDKKGRAHPR